MDYINKPFDLCNENFLVKWKLLIETNLKSIEEGRFEVY